MVQISLLELLMVIGAVFLLVTLFRAARPVKSRLCRQCFASVPAGGRFCPRCGQEFKP